MQRVIWLKNDDATPLHSLLFFMFTHSDIDSKSEFSKIESEDCFRSLKLYIKLKLKMENFEILRKKMQEVEMRKI